MSEHVTGHYRKQSVLFPNILDDYVDKENPARFIDAFIDRLNLEKLGFKHSVLADTGRLSYNPSDLLKLHIYGYLNQVRSTRKLKKECHRNVEVMWLMKKLAPDFKTIGEFRKDNVYSIDVINNLTDHHQLFNDAEMAKKTLGVEKLEVITDKGFYVANDVKDFEKHGITAFMPIPSFKSTKSIGVPEPEVSSGKSVYDAKREALNKHNIFASFSSLFFSNPFPYFSIRFNTFRYVSVLF